MPRYDFECTSCGEPQEVSCRYSDKPAAVACRCGGAAEQVFRSMPEVMVKGNTRPFALDDSCVPVGWEHGNTDPDKQERRYKERIGKMMKAGRAAKKHGIKQGLQYLGSVPRELDRMRRNQYGKRYWEDNTEQRLAEEGLLVK